MTEIHEELRSRLERALAKKVDFVLVEDSSRFPVKEECYRIDLEGVPTRCRVSKESSHIDPSDSAMKELVSMLVGYIIEDISEYE